MHSWAVPSEIEVISSPEPIRLGTTDNVLSILTANPVPSPIPIMLSLEGFD